MLTDKKMEHPASAVSRERRIVIIGAGISGLTAAYLLYKEGADVTVLEQKDAVGGSIETVKEKLFKIQ